MNPSSPASLVDGMKMTDQEPPQSPSVDDREAARQRLLLDRHTVWVDRFRSMWMDFQESHPHRFPHLEG